MRRVGQRVWQRLARAGQRLPHIARRRPWLVAILGVLALILVLGGMLVARGVQMLRPAAPPPVTLQTLSLTAPAAIAAGEPLTVTVSAEPASVKTQVLLTAVGTGGPLARTAPLANGSARIILPPEWTQAAGRVTITVSAGGQAAEHRLTIAPGAPANPLLTLTGPASAKIDGGDPPMLVTAPLDAAGNAVAPNTGMAVHVQQPGAAGRIGATLEITVPTRNLVAVARIFAGSVAGTLRAAAEAAGAYSPLQTVRVTPGDVVSPTLTAEPTTAAADGRSVVHLQTGPLADRYGNVLPDGTAVFLVATASDGSRRWLPAATVAGRAAAPLRAPLAAMTETVRALVGAAASPPVTITFTEPPAAPPLAVTAAVEKRAVALRAGPAVDDLGAYVPDGSSFTFTVSGADGARKIVTVGSKFGFADLSLPLDAAPPGVYTVEVTFGDRRAAASFSVPRSWE